MSLCDIPAPSQDLVEKYEQMKSTFYKRLLTAYGKLQASAPSMDSVQSEQTQAVRDFFEDLQTKPEFQAIVKVATWVNTTSHTSRNAFTPAANSCVTGPIAKKRTFFSTECLSTNLPPLICAVAWVRRQCPWWTEPAHQPWVCTDTTSAPTSESPWATPSTASRSTWTNTCPLSKEEDQPERKHLPAACHRW